MRVLVSSSLAAGVILAGASLFVLTRLGASSGQSAAFALAVVAAFLVPALAARAWLLRRGDEARATADRARETAERESASFRERRSALDQIFGALREGVLAVGSSGRVVFANDRIAELFDSSGPFEGRSVLEIVRKRSVAEAVESALAGQQVSERVIVPDGAAERQIEMSVVPIKPESGIAAVALFLDVTEVARLQRTRRDFLDDFSHEVGTPLAGLRSAAETLDGGALTPEHEQALRQVVLRQLNRIERLVKDVAELNRIESGELVLEKRRVDLHEVLGELCNEFRERLAGEKVTFKVVGEHLAAPADPLRLQQIFSNLLDNAWKHGGGGEITVELVREEGEAVIRVSDEGEGIAPYDAERIFSRFYRIDRSRSQAVPGVGLGLAIAKHLVLLHGGAIRAYNRPAGGATFEVRIPAA
ncbi:MAG TPA: ATP-binding protein [Thermoanaerobaculia bacterium]|nr:ATP-binding protein [Thermoanaerobaculia bacterium]